jgi:DMSO/TMAO reductase YedYZ molybdopterin-dependent catalytic subunit
LVLELTVPERRAFLRAWGRASGAIAVSLWTRRFLGKAGFAWAAEGVKDPLLVGRPLVRYPGKTDLILLTSRPPQLETPIKYFEDAITPNEAFYVRYHIPPPTSVDLSTWRLKVAGHLDKPLELSFDDLQTKFPRSSLVAVNQCAGNGRGYFAPRVFGGQWANGALGNAEWTGVRLRDVLSVAGVRAGAVDVSFNGLDQPVMPTVPDFVKSLTVSRIMNDPNILVAYQMNGQPLPMLNGFPARLIVPGWYATYWVKHLSEITILDKEFDGFWMRKAYLIPDTPCGCVAPGTAPTHTVPINRLDVRSLIIAPSGDQRLVGGKPVVLKGIAFDSGYGIQEVLVSTDSGVTWKRAELGKDLGNYSFRKWSFEWNPPRKGAYTLMARATNKIGESQPSEALWNPAGYLRNMIERVKVAVS